MGTINAKYCLADKSPYPPGNSIDFEYWASQNMPDINGYEYLGITWTNYFKEANFGKDKYKNADMQYLLDLKLDKNKRYYTCVQNDDGITWDVSKLNLLVFGMSGVRQDFNIPLVCQPHQYRFATEKDIPVSFVGNKTHPIRKKVLSLSGKDWYIQSGHHNIKSYCEIMARSKYVLCPRGYGKNSFRIAEALQYGAIPIYISDEFVMPYTDKEGREYGTPFESYGIKIHENQLDSIYDVISQHKPLNLHDLTWIHHTDYSYEGVKYKIIKYLESLN
jgi:hypothetical protein